MITSKTLAAIMPHAKRENIEKYIEPINAAMAKYAINTIDRQAAFLPQIAHESMFLSKVVESTFYSDPKHLFNTFPHVFKSAEDAKAYIRSPEKCANKIYAGKIGNGNEKSGDGYKYRGRGLIQITGKANYAECGKALDLDLINKPELLENPIYAAMSSGWFWNTRNCNQLADVGLFGKITKVINGGYNGSAERLALYANAKKVLA
jgi:putative chitinase